MSKDNVRKKVILWWNTKGHTVLRLYPLFLPFIWVFRQLRVKKRKKEKKEKRKKRKKYIKIYIFWSDHKIRVFSPYSLDVFFVFLFFFLIKFGFFKLPISMVLYILFMWKYFISKTSVVSKFYLWWYTKLDLLKKIAFQGIVWDGKNPQVE